MELRIFTEPQQGASYDDIRRIACATEDLGFDAFFRSDHYLNMGSGDGLPGPTDAWLTLAGLARETSRIRLGTLVSPVTFRLPGPLALMVAQVDAMSGGRVELGLGAGWFSAEHTAYGIDFPNTRERFERFAEQLAIVTGMWATPTGETFSHTGQHYTLTESPALPKPVQQPGPPIIIGGAGKKRTPELAVRYAAEFNCAFNSRDETRVILDRVVALSARVGRTDLVLSTGQPVFAGRTDAEVAARVSATGRTVDQVPAPAFIGSPAQIVDELGRYGELGVTRTYLQVLDLADLDHLELLAAEVLPQLTGDNSPGR